MRELVFGVADVRQKEGLQRAHELMETILPGLLLQLVEQDVHTADGCAGIRLGWIPGGSHRLVGGAEGIRNVGLFCAPDTQERLVSQEIFNAAIRKKHTEEFSATRFIGTAFPKISAFRNGLTEAKDPKRTGVSNLLCRFLGGVEPRIR